LIRAGHCRNPGRHGHGEARNIVSPDLHLSGVKTRPYLKPKETDRGHDIGCAVDRSRRTIECRKEAVAECLDDVAPEFLDLLEHHFIVIFEERAPFLVAQFLCALGRVHDVGEEDGRKNPIHLPGAA
jgi:hypothetical protein